MKTLLIIISILGIFALALIMGSVLTFPVLVDYLGISFDEFWESDLFPSFPWSCLTAITICFFFTGCGWGFLMKRNNLERKFSSVLIGYLLACLIWMSMADFVLHQALNGVAEYYECNSSFYFGLMIWPACAFVCTCAAFLYLNWDNHSTPLYHR